MRKLNLMYYIKKYRFNSVFLRNLIMIILVTAIPFGASCFIVYQRYASTANNEYQMQSVEKITKMADSMDNFIKSMDRLCLALLQRTDVLQIFVTDEDAVNLSTNYANIMDDINMFILTYGYIQNINVYSELNRIIISQAAARSVDEGVNNALQIEEPADEGLRVVASYGNGGQVKTITFIRGKKVGNEFLGTVSIDVHIDKLFKEMGISYNDADERLMLVDSNNQIILSSYIADINKQGENVFKNESERVNADGTGYMLNMLDSKAGDWTFVYMHNDDYLSGSKSRMLSMLLVVIFFSMFMVMLVAVYVSKKTFRPLAEILEYFGKNDTEHDDSSELSYIIRSITSLASENLYLTEENQKKIVMMNKAQCQALQNQINPHFIYNTLETIKWIVIDLEKNDNRASSTIEMLADVIGYGLDIEQYLADLQSEINNAKAYVEILKIRYENKFTVEWDIEPELENVRVLRLCVQPLIENAMLHGIVPKRSVGTIKISVKSDKKDLLIEVTDDGVGIDEDELQQIRSELSAANINGKHIGLSNVNLRAKLAFGDEYGVSIYSQKGVGTRTLLRMKKTFV